MYVQRKFIFLSIFLKIYEKARNNIVKTACFWLSSIFLFLIDIHILECSE